MRPASWRRKIWAAYMRPLHADDGPSNPGMTAKGEPWVATGVRAATGGRPYGFVSKRKRCVGTTPLCLSVSPMPVLTIPQPQVAVIVIHSTVGVNRRLLNERRGEPQHKLGRTLAGLAFKVKTTEFARRRAKGGEAVKLKVVVHEAEEGGYWAEVPAVPGCATQGDTFEELLSNLYEAVEGCLSVDVREVDVSGAGRVVEIAV